MLQSKVIFIAGATGLIGKEFCKAILKNNAKIILADINSSSLEKFKQELETEFTTENILQVTLDINSKKSIQEAIEKSHSVFKKIDTVVNTAYPRNKNYGKHFFDVTHEDFSENISLHLGGYFLLSQQFARYFLDNNLKGNIINLSSVYGVIAPRFEIYKDTPMTTPVEYVAIKSALIHLTSYMAKYFKDKNIRINCISPGGILDKQPESFLNKYKDNCLSKGMLDPEDLIGTLIFLLSDQSKYINGQNIIVDDGFVL
jgi:NAD(P)-dependent dehydrogenase (short-subunit alcohol dehydrogenase family)